MPEPYSLDLRERVFRYVDEVRVGAAAKLTERFLSAIVASERFLIDSEFIGGASFSIADIAAFTIIGAVSRHLAWDQLAHLAAWHDRIGLRTRCSNRDDCVGR